MKSTSFDIPKVNPNPKAYNYFTGAQRNPLFYSFTLCLVLFGCLINEETLNVITNEIRNNRLLLPSELFEKARSYARDNGSN